MKENTTMTWKPFALAMALMMVLAACGAESPAPAAAPDEPSDAAGAGSQTASSGPTSTVAVDPAVVAEALTGDGPSALDGLRGGFDASFPEPLIDVSAILSGGPPPDGIPPIDAPAFVDVASADEYLSDNEPVVYVELNGEARAYPVQVLIWHEIVNDVVGGEPVAVTYCPLCNSAVTYRATVDGELLTFGTSGSLYNSALIMYDRTTESLWTHYDGLAVVGTLTGVQLESIASPLLAWADFKTQFPDAQVLDRDSTGFSRAYGANPYRGYDNVDSTPFLFRGDVDDRAEMLRRIVGVTRDGFTKAWSLDDLIDGDASVTSGTVGETDLVIFWKGGQASALDSGTIDEGRDVGSVAVFVPVADGQRLTLAADGETFVDAETGSEWSITGKAISGSWEGAQLESVPHVDTFWFAWSSYRPETELVGG